jgi:hypothetical protein
VGTSLSGAVLLGHHLRVVLDLLAEGREVVVHGADVLGLDADGFLLLAQGLVHREQALRVLALGLVHRRELVPQRGYLRLERDDIRCSHRVAVGE